MTHHGSLLSDLVSKPGADLQRNPSVTTHRVPEPEGRGEVGNALKSTDEPAEAEAPCESTIHARAYQLEMLDKSLNRNIIVAVSWVSCLLLCRAMMNLTPCLRRWTLAVARLKCRLPYGT